ncbi:hypothetical protein, partial [Rhizobium ruizarguesonis]|uniref:hypothetical protein n=1 Tax=Rhizobium ruizarguesonis TaxID=2081791 RepID=UPI001952F82C
GAVQNRRGSNRSRMKLQWQVTGYVIAGGAQLAKGRPPSGFLGAECAAAQFHTYAYAAKANFRNRLGRRSR